ncbi:MAG: glycosyltransferase family 39 protein [Planctomycetes bacterium]|nr:glycosyltransferase family 39 protein [Planctomycetota bacterium]
MASPAVPEDPLPAARLGAPPPAAPPPPLAAGRAEGLLPLALRFLPLLLLAGYALLAVTSVREKSATFDEGIHLAAGYSYWRLQDYRISTAHPPLAFEWAALPLLPLQPRLDPAWPEWARADQWGVSRRFLYAAGNDADRLLFRARSMMVVLGAVLACAVWALARRALGPGPACVALFLACLSPELLAHGPLVTTDVPAALVFFAAWCAFLACLRRLTGTRALVAGALLGVAVCVKFTTLLLGPACALLAAVRVLRPEAWPVGWRPWAAPVPLRARRARALHALALLLACAAVAFVVVWAVYGFRYASSPSDAPADSTAFWRNYPAGGGLLERAALAARDLRLLPEGCLNSFLIVLRSGADRPAFLWGERRQGGWWWYFGATFLLKTPLPFLALLLLGAVAVAQGKLVPRGHAAAFLLPVALYALLCATAKMNIGHRHILAVYPFLFVVAAAGVAAVWRSGRREARIAVLGLLAWVALEAALVHPHYLAYFNQVAGGPDGGWRYLVDSNLDWGQDLKGLKAWLDERRGDPRFADPVVCYFGSASLDYYGLPRRRLPGYTPIPDPATVLPREPLPPGTIVAVSATNLQAVYYNEQNPRLRVLLELFARLRGQPPLAKIGYSIFVYEVQ